MNTKEAVQILRKHGYRVVGKSGEWYVGLDCSYFSRHEGSVERFSFNDRELILAVHSHVNGYYPTEAKKSVKHFRHRKNRMRTKEYLFREEYDMFSPKLLAADDNIWNWD